MPSEADLNRRDFFKKAAGTSAGLASVGAVNFFAGSERVLGANDRVRVAVVGLHGQGWYHVKRYCQLPGVEVVAICDVDENVSRQRLAEMQQMGLPQPATFVDFRKLLEDKSIDAVSIATPNFWHSLQTIWACQAGKDVYCEKPMCHNVEEGRQVLRAAEKYDRIVQHGTQSRSGKAVQDAVQKMRDGLIGEVYMARGLCYKWRKTIGHATVEPVPAGVDYDLWTGPAPLKPFTRNRFHYNWHWAWDTGNGDFGNQGIHELDIARWGLGVTYPTRVSATGAHVMFDDDQTTPNVLNVAYEFTMPDGEKRLLNFEVRHWITNHEADIGTSVFGGGDVPVAIGSAGAAAPKGHEMTVGNIFYGSNGYLVVNEYDSFKSWLTEDRQAGPQETASGDNWGNFIDCVRSRKKKQLNAPIEQGFISCALLHLGNASYRVGRSLQFDPVKKEVIGDEEASRLLHDDDRGYRAPYVLPENV